MKLIRRYSFVSMFFVGIVAIAVSLMLIQATGLNTSTVPAYRDLNKNQKLDIYEDPSKPIEDRVSDLLVQMNLEEKAGLMFINGTRINDDGSLDDKPAQGMFAFLPQAPKLIGDKKMTHFNLWAMPGAKAAATWYNNVQ